MYQSNIVVFKEIQIDDQTWFEWYKVGEDGESIVVDRVLDEFEHWMELEVD